jgi:hypothetical protein
MTEPAGSDLFPTPDAVEAERRDLTIGLLPSQLLREAPLLRRMRGDRASNHDPVGQRN